MKLQLVAALIIPKVLAAFGPKTLAGATSPRPSTTSVAFFSAPRVRNPEIDYSAPWFELYMHYAFFPAAPVEAVGTDETTSLDSNTTLPPKGLREHICGRCVHSPPAPEGLGHSMGARGV